MLSVGSEIRGVFYCLGVGEVFWRIQNANSKQIFFSFPYGLCECLSPPSLSFAVVCSLKNSLGFLRSICNMPKRCLS